MNKRLRVLISLLAGAAALTGCAALWNRGEAGSIGIIGGADGPTAVFVTTNFSPLGWGVAGLLLLAVIAGVVLFIRSRRK